MTIKLGQQNTIRFNLLVIGEAGLGKKTFLQSFFLNFINFQSICHKNYFKTKQPEDAFDKFIEQNVKKSTKEYKKEDEEIKLDEIAVFRVQGDTGLIEYHVYIAPGYGTLML